MSLRVLVITEHAGGDQSIATQIVRAMLAELGRKRAIVEACRRPYAGGVQRAMQPEFIADVVRSNPMSDIFLLLVDRDGVASRRETLDQLETNIQAGVAPGKLFLAENAWQEIEVWALAGWELPADWNWREIREHRDPKEAYYYPFARVQGVFDSFCQGRVELAKVAAAHYSRVRQRCPEDILNLETRPRDWLERDRG